jgi:Na+/H+ antiporter NhaD/arsenite permease-like protein
MLLPVIAGAILFTTYLVIAIGRAPYLRVDRTGAAFVGATLMVATGVIPLDAAYAAVDFRTLILLFGMMVLIAHLQMSGFFRIIVQQVAVRIHDPRLLLAAVVFVSGILSALFVNDTVCLIFTPIVIEIAVARGHRPLPFLLALATASNIGSAATITGNPQNMLIASVSHIRYAPFLGALGPVAIFGLVADALLLILFFRRDLRPTLFPSGGDAAAANEVSEAATPGPEGPMRVHRGLLIKSLVVATGVVAALLYGFEPALVAAMAAAVLLLTRRVRPEKVYRQIDWDLLVLFVGLFVIVAGVERVGLPQRLFALLAPVGLHTVAGLSLVTVIVSNVISNVPAVMLLARLVPQLPDASTAWLTLAMASTLAGNLLLHGSIANLIVLQGARRQHVEITFWQYFRVGLPVTLVTLAFGIWWLS